MPCFLLPFFDILEKMCMWGNGYFKYPFEILAMVQGWVPRGARFFDSVPTVLITHEQAYGISLRSE